MDISIVRCIEASKDKIDEVLEEVKKTVITADQVGFPHNFTRVYIRVNVVPEQLGEKELEKAIAQPIDSF